MGNSETLNRIKNSFESWYNKNYPQESPVSIAINYSDIQTLAIKAYHTIKMEVVALAVKNNQSFATPIITLQENYNHGITSEQEAKEGLIEKLLIRMYGYKQ